MRIINRERNKTLIVFDIAGIRKPSKAILFSFGVPVVIADYLKKEVVYLKERHPARSRNITRHIREARKHLLFPHDDQYTTEPVSLGHLRDTIKSLYQPMVDSILPHARESDAIKVREFKSKKGSLNIL